MSVFDGTLKPSADVSVFLKEQEEKLVPALAAMFDKYLFDRLPKWVDRTRMKRLLAERWLAETTKPAGGEPR